MSLLGRIGNSALEGLAQQSQSPSVGAASKGSSDFGKQLMDVLKEVNDTQQTAETKATDMMTGRQQVDYHDLMISMEKASTALQLTVAVRNKLLEAYQEIDRLQV